MGHIITYALVIAIVGAGLSALQGLQFVRIIPTNFYIFTLAIVFISLGVFAGVRLSASPRPETFTQNLQALKSLKITPQEQKVLEILATGQSNKEIARKLNSSPNTVKTQISSLYAKLGAKHRLDAINKARELRLVP